jgi:hypothetical protein
MLEEDKIVYSSIDESMVEFVADTFDIKFD